MHSIKEIRHTTKLTQKEFAKMYKIPLSTLKKWEQGESRTPEYVLNFLEMIMPSLQTKYKKITCKHGEIYYIDEYNYRIIDDYGNWINYSEDLNGIIESNLPIYVSELFNNLYHLLRKFDEDIYYDKKDKIEWE